MSSTTKGKQATKGQKQIHEENVATVKFYVQMSAIGIVSCTLCSPAAPCGGKLAVVDDVLSVCRLHTSPCTTSSFEIRRRRSPGYVVSVWWYVGGGGDSCFVVYATVPPSFMCCTLLLQYSALIAGVLRALSDRASLCYSDDAQDVKTNVRADGSAFGCRLRR